MISLLFASTVAQAGIVVTEELGADVTVSQDADYAYKTDVLSIRVPVRLISVAPYVAFETGHTGADELIFVVYEETAPDTWALIWQSALTPIGTTIDFQESEPIDLDLAANTRYAVGMYFPDGNYVYRYDPGGPPSDFGWGFFDGSVWSTTDSTFALPTVINQTPSTTGYYMQVTLEVPEDDDLDGFEVGDDCDDNDPTRYPGAPEQCDGVDDDCDGVIDNNVVDVLWFADTDGDGYGNGGDSLAVCDGSTPTGYVLDDLDCDDTEATVNPDGIELCDGRDGDCNGIVDDDPYTYTVFADADADGFGDPDAPVDICDGEPLADHVANDLDCNDASGASFPGAPEICDGLDNDCDGEADENQTFTTFYTDADGDGFGDLSNPVESCDGRPPGASADRTDCDDSDAERFPGNEEVCDGKDNDCDTLSGGEGDYDGDGWLDCEDCRSDDATTYPGAAELCDGIDHDCDGEIPDRLACDPAPDEIVKPAGCGCGSTAPGATWLALPVLALLLRRSRV